MAATTGLSLASFPYLRPEEFAEACERFEQHCNDKLSGSGWRSVMWDSEGLQICTTVDLPLKISQDPETVASHDSVMLEEDDDEHEDPVSILD